MISSLLLIWYFYWSFDFSYACSEAHNFAFYIREIRQEYFIYSTAISQPSELPSEENFLKGNGKYANIRLLRFDFFGNTREN